MPSYNQEYSFVAVLADQEDINKWVADKIHLQAKRQRNGLMIKNVDNQLRSWLLGALQNPYLYKCHREPRVFRGVATPTSGDCRISLITFASFAMTQGFCKAPPIKGEILEVILYL